MTYTIKKIADIAGISIRTLHHYDQIELLKPEGVSSSGYRLYSDSDLEKLQQILFLKELDFDLKEIKNIIESPDYDKRKALVSHRELLLKKKKRLNEVIKSIEKTIYSTERGRKMKKKDMFEAFDMSEIEKHKAKYAKEVKEKYGKTEAYRESQEKTEQYKKEDWARIKSSGDEIYKKIISLMDKGPKDNGVQNAIGEWRGHITDNFYNCTLDIFRGLGEMYVADERFKKFYENMQPGLAEFMRDAINIYCDTKGK